MVRPQLIAVPARERFPCWIDRVARATDGMTLPHDRVPCCGERLPCSLDEVPPVIAPCARVEKLSLAGISFAAAGDAFAKVGDADADSRGITRNTRGRTGRSGGKRWPRKGARRFQWVIELAPAPFWHTPALFSDAAAVFQIPTALSRRPTAVGCCPATVPVARNSRLPAPGIAPAARGQTL